MLDVLNKLQALQSHTPGLRRDDRCAALLLQCPPDLIDDATTLALDSRLLGAEVLRRVVLIRRTFEGTDPRWMFVAFKNLQQTLSAEEIHEQGSGPDDFTCGKQWVGREKAQLLIDEQS